MYREFIQSIDANKDPPSKSLGASNCMSGEYLQLFKAMLSANWEGAELQREDIMCCCIKFRSACVFVSLWADVDNQRELI